jgi:cellobiose phosphorylase
LGYTIIESTYYGVKTEITYFVPSRDTCEIWLVKISNLSGKEKDLDLFPYIEWLIGDYHLELRYRNIMNLYNRVWFDDDMEVVLAKKTADWAKFNIRPFPWLLFFGTSLPIRGYSTRKDIFLGRLNTEENPALITGKGVKNFGLCSGEDGVGAFSHSLKMLPGEKKEFVIFLGQTEGMREVKSLLDKYRDISRTKEELEIVRELWRKRIVDNIEVETPDRDFDNMVNVWVKYQMYICNFWSRSPSYYHEGSGGRGYRDSCQDAEGIVSIDPAHTKKKIKVIASLIRRDGSSAPGWSEIRGPASHEPNKDHPIWLTSTVSAYIKETGDKGILLEKVDYLKDHWINRGTSIDPEWKKGSISDGQGTIFEHLERNLISTFEDTGERGLPLIGHADWNDAIDAAGIKGKGESVWLAMALVRSLKLLAEMAELINRREKAKELYKKAELMTKRINRWAWDGNWYVRGFTDYGTVYGSSRNKEGKIFLNTQSWAILSGIVGGGKDNNRVERILKSIDRYLDGEHGLAMFAPAYTKFDPKLGRITMFSPGTKENAAVFCHTNTFMIVAYCMVGKGDKAYSCIRKILPNCQGDYDLYKTEPYVFAEYIVGPDHPYLYGEGAFTWITGTAAWAFLAATEWILGARREFEGLRVDPCIPSQWRRCRIRRPFRGAIYDIEIDNPHGKENGVSSIFVDGKRIQGTVISPHSDGKVHKVKVVLG